MGMGNIDGWSAPKDLVDTLPAERRNGIECDWSCVMEPKGVVLNIAPWNAPILLSVLPCLGALAAGNCCVIKPPEHCPKTSALLVELIGGALAPEAVTVVEGGPEVCEGLIDLGFDHIMFTGGTEIGKLVMARAARTLTPVTLELGGKNPVMIDSMGDGMLNAVIAEIVSTKQYFSGEFCQCHDTLLVVDSMWDRFTAALEAAVTALGERRNVRMIHAKHFERGECKRMAGRYKQRFSGDQHWSHADAIQLQCGHSRCWQLWSGRCKHLGRARVHDLLTCQARGAH